MSDLLVSEFSVYNCLAMWFLTGFSIAHCFGSVEQKEISPLSRDKSEAEGNGVQCSRSPFKFTKDSHFLHYVPHPKSSTSSQKPSLTDKQALSLARAYQIQKYQEVIVHIFVAILLLLVINCLYCPPYEHEDTVI